MGLRLKLHLSFILWLMVGVCYAQQSDSTGFFVMPGISCKPFSFSSGYSVTTSYSVIAGQYKFPLKAVVKFGFPNFQSPVKSPHDIEYKIDGSYIQPGVFFFLPVSEEDEAIYIGLLGYFGHYNHALTVEITDQLWGTNHVSYSAETRVKGIMFEFGGMMTLYKNLKLSSSLTFGGASFPINPIPQIQNFSDKKMILPGMGKGISGGDEDGDGEVDSDGGAFFGFNIGLHFIID